MEAIKILVAVALLNIVGVTYAKAGLLQEDDKQMHAGVSVVTGMAGNAFCYQNLGWTEGESWWCGIASSLLVGLVWEVAVSDELDWRDMQANAIGGAIGTTGIYTIYTW